LRPFSRSFSSDFRHCSTDSSAFDAEGWHLADAREPAPARAGADQRRPAATRRPESGHGGLLRTLISPLEARGEPMRILALSIIAALSVIAARAFAAPPEEDNSPWYPSLQAFEHYDSGRSHVFSQAEFRGSFQRPNTVAEVRSRELSYPSGYNMSYLNENEVFIQGGSYGDDPGSISPFVA